MDQLGIEDYIDTELVEHAEAECHVFDGYPTAVPEQEAGKFHVKGVVARELLERTHDVALAHADPDEQDRVAHEDGFQPFAHQRLGCT